MTDEQRARDVLTDAIGTSIIGASTAFGSLTMDSSMARVSEALGEWKKAIVIEAISATLEPLK